MIHPGIVWCFSFHHPDKWFEEFGSALEMQDASRLMGMMAVLYQAAMDHV